MDKYPYDNHVICNLTVQTVSWFFCYFLSISYKIAFVHYPLVNTGEILVTGLDPLWWCRQIILGWRVQTKPWTDENTSQRSRAAYRGKIDYI